MTQYKLPRTESGEVDWEDLAYDLREIDLGYGYEPNPEPEIGYDDFVNILKAIDANARAEERNSCALIAEGFQAATNSKAMASFCEAGVAGDVIERDLAIGRAIRARGDSQ